MLQCFKSFQLPKVFQTLTKRKHLWVNHLKGIVIGRGTFKAADVINRCEVDTSMADLETQ